MGEEPGACRCRGRRKSTSSIDEGPGLGADRLTAAYHANFTIRRPALRGEATPDLFCKWTREPLERLCAYNQR